MFNEDNTIEQMAISTLSKAGWKYVEAENLDRDYTDVMVESMVKDALIRLNPAIAEEPSRADEVIYKLRALIMSTDENNLITQNEAFKRLRLSKIHFRLEKMDELFQYHSLEQNRMECLIKMSMLSQTSGCIRRKRMESALILCF